MPKTTKTRLVKLHEVGDRLLSGGRLHKILIAIGAASIGPGALYAVIDALIAGEVRRRGAVTLTATDDPFAFYTLMLVGGVACRCRHISHATEAARAIMKLRHRGTGPWVRLPIQACGVRVAFDQRRG